MSELTPKQAQVVAILARAARRGAPPPTYREIAAEMRADVRVVFQHVEVLEKKGVLTRRGGRRGIELSPEYAPPVGVPVVGRVAAGLPILAEQNIDEYVDIRSFTAADDDSFLLKVRGDSMIDRHIFEGDFVLVRPQPRLDAGEVGVVAVNGEATVKEVHPQRDRIVLVSHNRQKGYADQVYGRSEDVRIVGKVIMAFRFVR
jgi:repressor LexA